jgi:hypothetical protein
MLGGEQLDARHCRAGSKLRRPSHSRDPTAFPQVHFPRRADACHMADEGDFVSLRTFLLTNWKA